MHEQWVAAAAHCVFSAACNAQRLNTQSQGLAPMALWPRCFTIKKERTFDFLIVTLLYVSFYA